MTDLIDSLLEFSRTQESLRLGYGSVKETVERAIHAVRANPESHAVKIALSAEGQSEAWFDAKKLERAIFNLLLNACEAVAPGLGKN